MFLSRRLKFDAWTLKKGLHKPSNEPSEMLILLHLRKIILMSCIVFLVCDLIEELLESLRPPSQLVRLRKKYEIQPWIHIYIVYIYMFVTLYRGRLNAFELALPTSSTH